MSPKRAFWTLFTLAMFVFVIITQSAMHGVLQGLATVCLIISAVQFGRSLEHDAHE